MRRSNKPVWIDLGPKESRIAHATRRLWRRLGITLSRPEYEELAQGIRSGDLPVAARGYKGRTVHAVEIKGKSAFAVFDSELDCICTFLPSLAWVLPEPGARRYG